MRTCAIREESRGQRVSGWSRARVRRRVGHVRPLFACSKAERASSRNTRRTGKIRATETHRLHVSREGRLGHSLLSLCGSAHGARLGPIARARRQGASASAPRGRAFSIELCHDKPFNGNVDRIFRLSNSIQTEFKEFADIQPSDAVERNGESQTHRPSDSFRLLSALSRQKNRASAVCLALRMRRGRGQTSRHARWSLRGGAAEARSSRRAGAAWCVSLPRCSPRTRGGAAPASARRGLRSKRDPATSHDRLLPSTRPRLTSPPPPAGSPRAPRFMPRARITRNPQNAVFPSSRCFVASMSPRRRRRAGETREGPSPPRITIRRSSRKRPRPPPGTSCPGSARPRLLRSSHARTVHPKPSTGAPTEESPPARRAARMICDATRRAAGAPRATASATTNPTARTLARGCGARSAGFCGRVTRVVTRAVTRVTTQVIPLRRRARVAARGRPRGGAVSTARRRDAKTSLPTEKRKRTTARNPNRFRLGTGTSRRDWTTRRVKHRSGARRMTW